MVESSTSESGTNQSRGWFSRLMTETLKRYTKNASADYLAKKYPRIPKDIIAERYVTQQARATALAGAASAAVVTLAAAGSAALAASVVAVPGLAITIPTWIAAFAIETDYSIRLQVRTAYDLCNLYGLSINADDPEDVQEIFALAMGIKAGELTSITLQRLAPGIVKQQARKLMRRKIMDTGIRSTVQKWASKNLSREIATRYLSEKFLLAAIVPGLNIIFVAGWNYFFTKGLGHVVQARVRGKGMSIELIHAIPIPVQARPELLLESALHIMMADRRESENELAAYKELAASLKKLHPDFVPENLGGQWSDADYWLAEIVSHEDEETRKAVYAISEIMTIIDGQVSRKEVKRLKQIAKLASTQVDEARLKERARPFHIQPAGRGCTIAVLIIGAGLLLGACASLISLWMLVAQFFQR